MKWKALAVIGWVVIVFGFLYVLSLAYEQQKTFVLFVFLAFAGNMAYDVTKTLIRLHPLYRSDWAALCKKGFGSVVLVSLSFCGIALDIFSVFPVHLGLLMWLIFYIWAMLRLSAMEAHFRLMRSNGIA